MEYSEKLIANWLTRQGCHWIYVDQKNFHRADGAKRADPTRPIHRPDLLAFLDGFGSIAIDVKSYDFKYHPTQYTVVFPDGEEQDVDDQYPWVDISWNEIVELQNFESVSNIPTWLCIIDTKDMRHAYWFRVSKLHSSLGRLFIPGSMVAYENSEIPEVRYFEDWPPIRLSPNTYGSISDIYFQLLIATLRDTSGLLTEYAEEVFVSPIFLPVEEGGSLKDLIGIRDAEPPVDIPPTTKQYNYARAIAKALNIGMPQRHNKQAFSDFISTHLDTYQKQRPQSCRMPR